MTLEIDPEAASRHKAQLMYQQVMVGEHVVGLVDMVEDMHEDDGQVRPGFYLLSVKPESPFVRHSTVYIQLMGVVRQVEP